MSKVFVLNSYGNPVHQASKWGEVVEITTGNINPFAIDRLAWSISPNLASFTKEDYFLLAGPGSGYIISTLMLLSRLDEIRCLRYVSSQREYVEIVIRKKDIQDILDTLDTFVPRAPGRIFVINYSGHSIEPAFGFSDLPLEDKLVNVTTGNVDQFDIAGLTQSITTTLHEFEYGDMLLLSGPAILHVLCAAALAVMGKSFAILIYNPKLRQYIKREVDLPHVNQVALLGKEAVA